jgi:hypothetical protein
VSRREAIRLLGALFGAVLAAPALAAELGKDMRDLLATSTFVYISSTRKDGTLSKPAEIWFLWHQGSVYVASAPTTWRVKRIRWGRPAAKIWIGKPDGPAFAATGAVVTEPAVHEVMFKTFAEKYGLRWKAWESSFRSGLADGSRVLVRYTPQV